MLYICDRSTPDLNKEDELMLAYCQLDPYKNFKEY